MRKLFLIPVLFITITALRFNNATVINTTNDTVTVVTQDGNAWDFYGDGFKVGQNVKVVFDTNSTDTIYDDKIIDVK